SGKAAPSTRIVAVSHGRTLRTLIRIKSIKSRRHDAPRAKIAESYDAKMAPPVSGGERDFVERGAIQNVDALRLRHGDGSGAAQRAEDAAHRLDGKAEIVGNVVTRHRQLDGLVDADVLGHVEKEGDDALGRGLATEAEHALMRRGEPVERHLA